MNGINDSFTIDQASYDNPPDQGRYEAAKLNEQNARHNLWQAGLNDTDAEEAYKQAVLETSEAEIALQKMAGLMDSAAQGSGAIAAIAAGVGRMSGTSVSYAPAIAISTAIQNTVNAAVLGSEAMKNLSGALDGASSASSSGYTPYGNTTFTATNLGATGAYTPSVIQGTYTPYPNPATPALAYNPSTDSNNIPYGRKSYNVEQLILDELAQEKEALLQLIESEELAERDQIEQDQMKRDQALRQQMQQIQQEQDEQRKEEANAKLIRRMMILNHHYHRHHAPHPNNNNHNPHNSFSNNPFNSNSNSGGGFDPASRMQYSWQTEMRPASVDNPAPPNDPPPPQTYPVPQDDGSPMTAMTAK